MRKSKQLTVGSWQKTARAQRALAWPLLLLFVSLAAIEAASWQPAQAQAPASVSEKGSAELYQSLLDLQNPWTVMCVAAHPDDEDGATLTVLRRKYGAHTVTLFSTFGEGGQNAVGPELYEELGAIRARETEEAARIQGSEPYFLGLRDFGFSKSADEAFTIWGHDEALRRMVLKIRELRPDVIITNHDTTSGHGHHQATGRLVLEAFDAAADPRRFPEQLKGDLGAWQVQRLFVRFQFEGAGSKTAEEEAQRSGKVVSINPNERDAVRGTTYAEQALQALQRHATQGPWPQTVPAGGRPVIRYRLARTATDAQALPAGAQSVLDGLVMPKDVAWQVEPLSAKVTAILQTDPAKDRRSLINTLGTANVGVPLGTGAPLMTLKRFFLMRDRLNRALAEASRVSATLSAQNDVLIPGEATDFTLKITNGGEGPAIIKRIDLTGLTPASATTFPKTLAQGETFSISVRHETPRTATITVPRADHLYDGRLWGEALAARVSVQVDRAEFPVDTTLHMDVAPAVEIVSISPSPLVLTPGWQSSSRMRIKAYPTNLFNLRLVNHQNRAFNGAVVIKGLSSAAVESRGDVSLKPKQASEVMVMRIGDFDSLNTNASGKMPPTDSLTFSIMEKGNSSVPLDRRQVRVVRSDARVAPGLRVGYVRSFDETLKNSLDLLGVEAEELSINDVRTASLSKYHAIIIDNRGYQAHPELIGSNARLMDYVREGGTLIVFYHRTNEWNPDEQRARPQLAPYPIILGGSRVTDENAAVEIAEAAHPLLNYPNKITAADFAGWIQERGLYYPQTWDSHYAAPLSTNDAGEPALRGGLLAADYGRGRYIYTSMVWYRELRAGIPGAYRMLANMISYGR